MDFGKSAEHELIVKSVRDIASDYDRSYWQDVRSKMRFPFEFHEDLAAGGWLSIPFPEEYDGHGLGLEEHVLVMMTLAEEGAWIGASGMVTGTIFGGLSILRKGSEAQKQEYLPAIADGQLWALGVTEPDAGLNTTNTATRAVRDGDEYVINGQKQWTSGIAHADKLLLLARTTPKDESDSPYEGLTMFVADPSDDAIEYSEIPLDIYFTEKTYQVHIEDLRVPEENILGEEGKGLKQIFDTLNTERIATAAQNWGAGIHTLNIAAEHARNRVVWSEPIGAHQAIQHPLADAYADLQTARMAIERSAWQFDEQEGDVGEASNIANLQAGKAAFAAAEAAMTTLGGMSASSEMGVSAAWEFIRRSRSVPVSEEMIRNYLGTHSLGLPRSYDPA